MSRGFCDSGESDLSVSVDGIASGNAAEFRQVSIYGSYFHRKSGRPARCKSPVQEARFLSSLIIDDE